MTTDALTRPETSTTSAQTSVTSGSSTICVTTIDDSFFRHLSQSYWQWRELCEQDPQARVTQHPDLVLAELRHAEESAGRPAVLVECRVQDRLTAAAVLIPKSTTGEKRFGIGWGLSGYRLAGNRTLGSVPLDGTVPFALAVAGQLIQTRADFLLIEDVDTGAPVLNLLAGKHCPLQAYRPALPQQRHRIALPDSFEEYMSKFKSRTRNTLRRKVKKFGECRLERVTELQQLPDFLSAAHDISKHTWQTAMLGLRIHDNDREYDCFTTLVQLQALRAYLLWQGDTPVSFCIGTQFNGVYDYEEVGYDRRYAHSSPGQVMVLKIIEDLYRSNTPRLFDFGGGDADYKRQFANLESESGNIWLLRPGVRSFAIRSYFDSRRLASRTLRSICRKAGVMDRIRQLTRRGFERPHPAGSSDQQQSASQPHQNGSGA
ncbi:MAG: GNAT family N-acetyltransferase [Planctomycetota bacterium]|jgi:CelD/BcsL family acetyltransferase involved in cellulose biosynthesis